MLLLEPIGVLSQLNMKNNMYNVDMIFSFNLVLRVIFIFILYHISKNLSGAISAPLLHSIVLEFKTKLLKKSTSLSGAKAVTWLIQASRQGNDEATKLLQKCQKTKTGKGNTDHWCR